MVILLNLILAASFYLNPISSTGVYMDVNGYQTFNLQLVNDAILRNVFAKIVWVQAPSGLMGQVCARGICHPFDTLTIRNIQPYEVVDIAVEMFAGNEPGSVLAYLLVFDLSDPSQRDSVIFSGVVPVKEGNKNIGGVVYSSGVLKGDQIEKVEVFDVTGKKVFEKEFDGVNNVPLELRGGLYLILVKQKQEDLFLKVLKLE
ncbi:MAG: T9SS type A sorting domain-containing protein [Candidatus Hydrothermia bacterium]